MFRNKTTLEYLRQSDYKDHLIENYPTLIDSGYAPIVLDFLKRNKMKDSPYLSKIEDTVYTSAIYLLALLLGKEGIDGRNMGSNERFQLYKSLEDELILPLMSKYPALESIGNKSKEHLLWFATTYETCSYLDSLTEEQVNELIIMNKLSLYNIKSPVRETARMIIDIQSKFPNLRFESLMKLAIDEWNNEDLPVLLKRFKYFQYFAEPSKGKQAYSISIVTWPPTLLNADNGVFAVSDNRIEEVLSIKNRQQSLADMLVSNVNNKMVVTDENSKALTLVAQSENNVLDALAISKSLTWGPKESEFDKINEEISRKVSRYFNKPSFPTPFDIAILTQDSNLLSRKISITDKQVTVGENVYAINEDNFYHFINSANEPIQGVTIKSESICHIKLENIAFICSNYKGDTPLAVQTGSTVECIGNVSLSGSSYASAIRPIPNKEDEFLYIKGEGTLTVSGGSHAPAIGYAGHSQSYGRWTEQWVDKILKVRIENVKVVTENCPRSLGIGIYSNEGETTVEVINADTTGIVGYGADLVRICRYESGSTKMSSPLYIADLTELKKALTESGETFEDHYIRYGGPSKDLIQLALNKEDLNLLKAIEDITVDYCEYSVQLPVDHPMFSALVGLPNLGAQTRKQYDGSSISSDISVTDL